MNPVNDNVNRDAWTLPPQCPGCGAKDGEAHLKICRFILDREWALEQITKYNTENKS